MPVVKDVLMMLVMVGKMSRLSYRSVVGSQEFAGVPLIIFERKSSVTGSKVCKGSTMKEASEEAVGFGGGKLFLMVRIFSVKYSEKTVGRSSESKAEGKSCLQVVLDWIFAEKLVFFALSIRSVTFSLMESQICLWTVSLDLSQRLSAFRRSRFSSQNCSAILLNRGVGFLVRDA